MTAGFPQLQTSHPDIDATILFLAANPATSERLDLGEECRAIENKVRAAKFGDRIRFRPRWAARADDLLQALHEDDPSVLHFSGHASGDRGLWFQSEDGGSVFVSSDGLGQVIRAAGDSIKLVVLNACYTKVQGDALVAVVPCVIGMPEAIGDRAAITYAADFYRALAFGKSVATAHQCGLAALVLHSAGGTVRDVDLASAALSAPTPVILTRPDVDSRHIYIVRPEEKRGDMALASDRYRVHIEIDIDTELENIDAETLAKVMTEIRRVSGGHVVRLICVSKGSVRLTLSFHPEAAQRLMELRAEGRWTEVCGMAVSDVAELAHVELEARPPQPGIASTGNHVIATIGIDRYAAWPHLASAVHDARGVSTVFRELGFRDAYSLVDEAATGAAILRLVTDDLSVLGVDDSLVIFFAGHGANTTHTLDDGVVIKTGYIVPVDAQNASGHVASWIRLDAWLDDIARLPPRHILVILDACHSGIALGALHNARYRHAGTDHRMYERGGDGEWRIVDGDRIATLSSRRSRRVIVSALDGQIAHIGGPAVGHSLFTGCLIEALTGALPHDGRRRATVTELGLYLQQRVAHFTNAQQTPDFGAFSLDDRGELMIPLALDPTSQEALVAPALPPDRSELDQPHHAAAAHPAGSWSHLAFESRQGDAAADPPGALLVASTELIEGVVTLRWIGARPEDPRIEVSSEWLFGRTVPLLHEVSPVPTDEPSTARWLVRIPVPHARLRTRRVTIRCEGTAVEEQCYVVPRAGVLCAGMLYPAFAAFASSWLWSLNYPAMAVLAVLLGGVMSWLWSLVTSRSRHASSRKWRFARLAFAAEPAALLVTLATLLLLLAT